MSKRVKWPDVIELPWNWDETRNIVLEMDDGCSARDEDARRPGKGQPMCVSMFLGKRLGIEGWDNAASSAARERLLAIGYTALQANILVRMNDAYSDVLASERGTKAAIRKALEWKGYEVPA